MFFRVYKTESNRVAPNSTSALVRDINRHVQELYGVYGVAASLIRVIHSDRDAVIICAEEGDILARALSVEGLQYEKSSLLINLV